MSDNFLNSLAEHRSGRKLILKEADLVAPPGGAGAVYAHPLDPGACIKLYLKDAEAQAHDSKVRAMLASPPDNVRTKGGVLQIAWPSEVVLRNGRFAGFVMPKLPNGTWRFDALDTPLARRQKHTSESVKFRLVTLYNLAKVLESLHAKDHFVIDLQPKNIYAYAQDAGAPPANSGFVSLIDCDGFSIAGTPGSGKRYHADLVMEDYYSPHALDSATLTPSAERLRGFERQQDIWAFALNAFRMLNHGIKPWDALPKAHVRNPPDGKFRRIFELDRNYAYGSKGHPDFDALPTSRHASFDPELLELFERTFRSSPIQPTLQEWTGVLQRLLSKQNACSRSSDHWKLGATCGECNARPSTIVAPIPDPGSHGGNGGRGGGTGGHGGGSQGSGGGGHGGTSGGGSGGGIGGGGGHGGGGGKLRQFFSDYWWTAPVAAVALAAAQYSGETPATTSGGIPDTQPTENAGMVLDSSQPLVLNPYQFSEDSRFDSYWKTDEGLTELVERSNAINREMAQPLLQCFYKSADSSQTILYWNGRLPAAANWQELAKIQYDHPYQTIRPAVQKCPDVFEPEHPFYDAEKAKELGREKRKKDQDLVTFSIITQGGGDAPRPTDTVLINVMVRAPGNEVLSNDKNLVVEINGINSVISEQLLTMKKGENRRVFVPPAVVREKFASIAKGASNLTIDIDLLDFKATPAPPQVQPTQPTPQLPSRPTDEPPSRPRPEPTEMPGPRQTPSQQNPYTASFEGDWVGTYRCAQGETGVSIELYKTSPYLISGTFNFSATSRNPRAPSGSFRLSGKTSPGSRSVILDPSGWITRPSGYHALRVRLTLSPDGNSVSGSFPAESACTTLHATRR